MENRAYWVIKTFKFNFKLVGSNRNSELKKVEEIRRDVYESTWIYKAKVKIFMLNHFCIILDFIFSQVSLAQDR